MGSLITSTLEISILFKIVIGGASRSMGNSECCSGPAGLEKEPFDDSAKDLQQRKKYIKYHRPANEQHYLSTLSYQIKSRLTSLKPFQNELCKYEGMVKYGEDIYEGTLNDDGRAQGIGRMYKANGSLYVGELKNGEANGYGYYFMKDGSYFQGKFVNNKANDHHGKLILSDDSKYCGEFVDNVLNGPGKEEGQHYKFDGTYLHGRRVNGTLDWVKDGKQYKYTGPFDDENQFTMHGTLVEPSGTYVGKFVKGKKHGVGTYTFVNKLKYIGNYANGEKEGEGTILNRDGTIGYKGQWKNGLPHGRGFTVRDNGEKVPSQYEEGIDTRFLL